MSGRECDDAPRLLALACSPRRGGNTETLLDAALEGAAQTGACIERFHLRELRISPCLHCGGCVRTPGQCVIDDDMQQLYEPLRAADRIILASPVFFMSVTAQAKAMIDRCQPLWVLRAIEQQPVAASRLARAALYLGAGGAASPDSFDGARLTLNAWYWTLEIAERRELTFGGMDDEGAIRGHPTALDEARRAGCDLAAWRSHEE